MLTSRSVIGSEQGGIRPVLIVQNDIGNRYSPTVIAAAITSRMGKTRLPTHIDIMTEEAGLMKDSVVLTEQIRTLDKRRLKGKIYHLGESVMASVDEALNISSGLVELECPQVWERLTQAGRIPRRIQQNEGHVYMRYA